MKQFVRPEFSLVADDKGKKYGVFLVEPLERGFGITLGNALRRTLLSSTPGAAVYALRIKGASHEFAALNGVIENITRIVLNIKGLVLRVDRSIINDGETVVMKVFADKEGVVTGKDIECPTGVEVLNKAHHIVTISKGGVFDMELYVKNSRGYKSFSENKREKKYSDLIVIDSNYSPIQKVNYNVEQTKVGKLADLEKLTIEVETDGSIIPTDAIAMASKVLSEHLSFFVNLNEEIKNQQIVSSELELEEDEVDKSIDELDLTQRSQNCLKRAKIESIRDLISKTEQEIQEIRNLGKKSFNEIREKVAQMGLNFRAE